MAGLALTEAWLLTYCKRCPPNLLIQYATISRINVTANESEGRVMN